MSLTVYLGQPMSGFDKPEMLALAANAQRIFNEHGISTWSPVLAEGVRGIGKLRPGVGLDEKWPMDKRALRYKCFVFVNLRGDEKSFGCEREHGLVRFCFWRPVVIVSPRHAGGYVSIANWEDDIVVGTVEEAAALICEKWGTWHMRRLWQFKMYWRSLLRFFVVHAVGGTL